MGVAKMTTPYQILNNSNLVTERAIIDNVDKDFETYVQERGKLSRHCTSRSKIESIHTKSRMKGQGSHELVEELKKETQK